MIHRLLKGRIGTAGWAILILNCVLLLGLVLGGVFSPKSATTAFAREAVPGAVLTLSESAGFEPGKMYYDSLPPNPGAPSDYVAAAKWDKNPVTYSFSNCPRALDCGLAQQAVREAIEAWDAVCGLRLDEVSSEGDIRILWASGSHGDGEPFDGPGNVLAHAFFPLAWLGPLAGDLHFDDDETWVVDNPTSNYQIHLKTVAMHESGHSLGLDHSNDPSSLMWAEYTGVRGLGADDIAGIQSLYGPPTPDEGGPAAPPAPAGVTATSTTTVRIRSGPGTSYSTLGRVPYNTTVPVLGRNADNTWLFIDYNGTQGWVAAHLFRINGDLNTVPVVDQGGGGAPPQPTPTPPSSPTGVTATATTTVRIRQGPGTNYPTAGKVTANTTVPVLGRNADSSWLFIDNNGTQGWVAAWLFIINGDLNSVPVMLVQGFLISGDTLIAWMPDMLRLEPMPLGV